MSFALDSKNMQSLPNSVVGRECQTHRRFKETDTTFWRNFADQEASLEKKD